MRLAVNFCSSCGAPVELRVPEGDNLPRHICTECAAVHYQNPKVVAGCLAEWDERILLCRRAIEPRHGLWTLPAGFMENGETTEAAAARETLEEANARIEMHGLYTLFSLPDVDQVYLMYRARLLDLDFSPGPESLEVALFTEEQIPWEQLAFPTIGETLRRFFADRRSGRFAVHTGVIRR